MTSTVHGTLLFVLRSKLTPFPSQLCTTRKEILKARWLGFILTLLLSKPSIRFKRVA